MYISSCICNMNSLNEELALAVKPPLQFDMDVITLVNVDSL